ncbi:MAG TPA: TonB family protein [Haliangiales bacterium]|nr:TonB family protein [Haliangiales bacterium]
MRPRFFSVVLSLALHAVAFALAALLLRPPPPTAPRVSFDVEGRAVRGAASQQAAGAAESPAPARAAEPSRAPARRRAPAAAPGGTEAPAVASAIPVESGGGEPAPEPAPLPGSGRAPGPPPVDADAIRAAIQARVQYPRLARSQGLEGTVVVRFRLGPGGAPEEITIVASAGALLDEAARRAVERAAPFPPGAGWVRVPIEFALRPPP